MYREELLYLLNTHNVYIFFKLKLKLYSVYVYYVAIFSLLPPTLHVKWRNLTPRFVLLLKLGN